MPSELISVTLTRDSEDESWGFQLDGGREQGKPLIISQIEANSIAEIVGLKAEDIIIKINNKESAHLTCSEAVDELGQLPDSLKLTIERSCAARKISYEKSAGSFNLILGPRGSEVVQDKEAFFSNREELQRTTTAAVKLKPEHSYIVEVSNPVDRAFTGRKVSNDQSNKTDPDGPPEEESNVTPCQEDTSRISSVRIVEDPSSGQDYQDYQLVQIPDEPEGEHRVPVEEVIEEPRYFHPLTAQEASSGKGQSTSIPGKQGLPEAHTRNFETEVVREDRIEVPKNVRSLTQTPSGQPVEEVIEVPRYFHPLTQSQGSPPNQKNSSTKQAENSKAAAEHQKRLTSPETRQPVEEVIEVPRYFHPLTQSQGGPPKQKNSSTEQAGNSKAAAEHQERLTSPETRQPVEEVIEVPRYFQPLTRNQPRIPQTQTTTQSPQTPGNQKNNSPQQADNLKAPVHHQERLVSQETRQPVEEVIEVPRYYQPLTTNQSKTSPSQTATRTQETSGASEPKAKQKLKVIAKTNIDTALAEDVGKATPSKLREQPESHQSNTLDIVTEVTDKKAFKPRIVVNVEEPHLSSEQVQVIAGSPAPTDLRTQGEALHVAVKKPRVIVETHQDTKAKPTEPAIEIEVKSTGPEKTAKKQKLHFTVTTDEPCDQTAEQLQSAVESVPTKVTFRLNQPKKASSTSFPMEQGAHQLAEPSQAVMNPETARDDAGGELYVCQDQSVSGRPTPGNDNVSDQDEVKLVAAPTHEDTLGVTKPSRGESRKELSSNAPESVSVKSVPQDLEKHKAKYSDAWAPHKAQDVASPRQDFETSHEMVQSTKRHFEGSQEDAMGVGTSDVKPKAKKLSFKFLEETKPVTRWVRPKPNRLPNWNCPWVQEDGSGLKGVIWNHYQDDTVMPPGSSHQHFYSEPHSILDEPLTAEEVSELQRMFCEQTKRLSELERQKKERAQAEEASRRAAFDREHQKLDEERRMYLKQQEEASSAGRRDSLKKVRFADAGKCHEEEDEPPPLETIEDLQAREMMRQKLKAQMILEEQLVGEDKALLQHLTEAVQAGMEEYQSSQSSEPSAEELIEVLKSLESLAASKPLAYRSIVEQIRANMSQVNDDRNLPTFQNDQEHSQTTQKEVVHEIHDSTTAMPNHQGTSDFPHGIAAVPVSQAPLPEPSQLSTRDLQRKKYEKYFLLEEELQEDQKRIESPTPRPKANVEQLQPRPVFSEYDYPWAGSLKPISNEIFSRHNQKRRGTDDPGPCPWAGSLKHVNEVRVRGTRTNFKGGPLSDQSELPPWVHSLRHVNKSGGPAKSFKVEPEWQDRVWPKSIVKRATTDHNEVPSRAAEQQKPATTPQGSSTVQPNRSLAECRTVSSALLELLMPKLLEIHESKYDHLGRNESLVIMEDILAAKIGLNPRESLDNSPEAQRMIQAIMEGQIDQAVYSQMADDLETEAKLRRNQSSEANLNRFEVPRTPPPTPMVKPSPPRLAATHSEPHLAPEQASPTSIMRQGPTFEVQEDEF